MLIRHFSYRRQLLCTTMCCLFTIVCAPDAFAAFDPDAGANLAPPPGYHAPVRKRAASQPMMMINRSAAPLYPTTDRGLVPAVDKVEMPKPLYPMRAIPVNAPASQPVVATAVEPVMEREMEIASSTIAPLPTMTPLAVQDEEAPAKNKDVAIVEPAPMTAPAASGETQMAGYIAPPPPLPDIAPVATTIVAPAPVASTAVARPVIASPAPVPSTAMAGSAPVDIVEPRDLRASTGAAMNTTLNVAPPPPVIGTNAPPPSEMHSKLSPETKAILGRIPSHVGTAAAPTFSRTAVNRVSPQVARLIPELEKDAEYESVGLKISVSRQHLDSGYELNRAYDALIAGDSEQAVDIYQNIIADQPQNQDALFGLAATYHRAGELAKARPLYGALLRINPEHREGLNNFLVLVSDEAPEEALFELQKLQQRNPDFSPIPAQMALVLEKLGQADMARDQMMKAIRLAPENLVYKYNLAVMMDRQGRYADASALYGLLVDAALRGESIPAPLEDIQKRLNYINTASNEMVRGG